MNRHDQDDEPLYIGFRLSDVETRRALDRVGDVMGLSSREQLMRMIVSVFLEDFAANEDKASSRGYKHLRELRAIARGGSPSGPADKRKRRR